MMAAPRLAAGSLGALCLAVMAAAVADEPPAAVESCAYCHGYDGNVTSLRFPRLAGQPAAYLARQLRDYRDGRRQGNGEMEPAAQDLSERGIDAVAAYFASQPVQAPARGARTDNALGEQLYLRGKHGMVACIACHVPQGRAVPFDYPRLLGQNRGYVRRQLQAYRSGARNNDELAVMRDIARRLSDAEIAALSDYAAQAGP